MKCSKCGKDATAPLQFKGESYCVGCGYLALEKAKEDEAEIEAITAELGRLNVKLTECSISVAAKLKALQEAQGSLAAAEGERDDCASRIDHLESKLSMLK